MQGVDRRPHVLHVHAVDVLDLLHEEGHQVVVGQVDGQFVDRPTTATFQDVDADDVAAHRPDPARHLTEGTRSVGQPHPHDPRRHAEHRTEEV